MGKALSRRDFLKLSGAGLAGGALLGAAGCGGGGAESNELTVTFGPDPAGALQKVIDQFNQANEGGIQAKYRQMPADSSQYRDQITTELQAGGGDTDVIIADSVWVAQFAANGWISDLSNRFAEASRSNYLEATIEASTFEDRVYGVPQYASLAMLYYRKDLLKQSGFDEPPETWDELKEQAEQVMRDSDTEFGFVFQGGNYEGGVVNGLEYIWNAGGDVLDGDTVVIDSPESVEGLEIERSMVEDGIASEAVSNYKEQDAQIAFLNGDAVFCRNYSYMYTLSSDPSESEVEPEQIGVSSIPVASEGDRSYSGFGLWTSLINGSSQLQDA
ncbi:MAG: extracellular solute-binding protein, partial [Rubrobacteraceae bacterium]